MLLRSHSLRRLIIAVGLLAFLGGLAIMPGCNTVKGIGRDIEAMGQGGEDILNGN